MWPLVTGYAHCCGTSLWLGLRISFARSDTPLPLSPQPLLPSRSHSISSLWLGLLDRSLYSFSHLGNKVSPDPLSGCHSRQSSDSWLCQWLIGEPAPPLYSGFQFRDCTTGSQGLYRLTPSCRFPGLLSTLPMQTSFSTTSLGKPLPQGQYPRDSAPHMVFSFSPH